MPNLTMMTQVNSTDPLGGGLGARKPRADEIAKRDAEIAAKEAAEQRAYSFEKIVHATEKQMRQEAVGERASGSAPLGNSSGPTNPGAGQKLDERGYIIKNYLVQAAAAEAMSQEIADWWKPRSGLSSSNWWDDRLDGLNYAGISTSRISSSTPAATEVQKPAAERIWPDDFKREIEDLGCDLLKVFCDHHNTQIREALIFSGAERTGVSPRDYLAGLKKDYYALSGEKVWFTSACDNGNRVFYYRKATPKAS